MRNLFLPRSGYHSNISIKNKIKRNYNPTSKIQDRSNDRSTIALIISIITLIFTFLPPLLRAIWGLEIIKFEEYEFETYQNIRFGFEMKYPKTWLALKEPMNGDGIIIKELKDPNKVEIRAYGRHEIIDPGAEWKDENWYTYIKNIQDHLGLFEKCYETRVKVSYLYDIGGGKKIELTINNPAIYIVRYGFLTLFPIKYELITIVKGIGYHIEATVPWYRSYYYRNLISYIISTFKIGPYSGELGTNYLTETPKEVVKLYEPKNGEHTKMSYIIVSGQVSYPEFRPELYVNGETISYAENGYFTYKENLIPGKNIIRVVEWYKSFGTYFKSSEVAVYRDQ